MANDQNLKPFQPGQSGNPAGSSRKARLTTQLLKLVDEKGIEAPFVQVGLAQALKGDFKFWSYIFDRIDGPITKPDRAPEIDIGSLIGEVQRRAGKRKRSRKPRKADD